MEEIHDEFGHDFYRTEGYLQGRYDLLPFLSIALGIRLGYLNVTEQLSIQPRGSMSLPAAQWFQPPFRVWTL